MSKSGVNDMGCLIRFIPAGAKKETKTVKDTAGQAGCQEALSGEQAKAFYEELIQEDSAPETEGERKTHRRKEDSSCEAGCSRKSRSHRKSSQQKAKCASELLATKRHANSTEQSSKVESVRHWQNDNQLLTHAQNGDLQELTKLLKRAPRVDVDHRDQYGWTALMCATVARHRKIVQYLLSKGANRCLKNKNGKTAMDLALDIGAQDIIKTLVKSEESTQQPTHASTKDKQKQSFFCETCKSTFSESSQQEHSSSTVHLFNLKLKPKPDPFMIPQSNVGYRLMRSSGWDGEAGLGPEGKGAKFPVKTVLKTDRHCLGSKESQKKKAKITHFGPNDTDSVKIEHKDTLHRVLSARASSKKERRRREQKGKRWETNLRQYMNMDCDAILFEKL